MRKIQIERTLFELFGHKFFVFENFHDADLNIDDKSIYKHDNQEQLINIFATNQFFAIWSDERRLNAGVICACEGNLCLIIAFLKKIGVKDDAYSTFDCGLGGEPRVLYLTSQDGMYAFIHNLASATIAKKSAVTAFFGNCDSKVLL